ncbi:hypothetical protein SDJN03_18708, partial [Cucurbita argyrosperma subsp. sororia]
MISWPIGMLELKPTSLFPTGHFVEVYYIAEFKYAHKIDRLELSSSKEDKKLRDQDFLKKTAIVVYLSTTNKTTEIIDLVPKGNPPGPSFPNLYYKGKDKER